MKFKKEKFTQFNLKTNLMEMKMHVFIDYINFHFPLNGQSHKVYSNKLRKLENIEENVLINAISRTKAFEKIHETKYGTFFVGAILASIVPVIAVFGDLNPTYIIPIRFYIMGFTMLTLMYFLKAMNKDKYVVALMQSFRELLEQTLAKKGNSDNE